MAVIINFSARLARRKLIAPVQQPPKKDADILVFTGVRYESKGTDRGPLTADQSGRGKR
jgi:hypothetical protein